jgi:hypothetical protein
MKLWILVAVVAIAVYGSVIQWEKSQPVKGVQVHQKPTIVFVPKGTPGAKTLDEINREELERKGLRKK